MAVFGQGAPGVRIQLRDESQIDLVTQPIVTGGVVGFSSRGELNKIIDITSTADMDVILGQGFNNPQFNQGLYAARAVVQSGGFVEFVRPYGEEIILDDTNSEYSYNQKLKTDTYLVEYNFTRPEDPSVENIPDSFATKYMASTRYIQDSLAGMGEREVYTISETISKNSNINFYLDADETIVNDEDTVSLFAIMNSDPTAARRAGDRFAISSIKLGNSTGAVIEVVSKNNHGFTAGETVYITGTSQYNGAFQISSIDSAKKFSFVDTTKNGQTPLPETDGAIYINADTVQSGVDYLEVKTAARGKSSKKLGSLVLDNIPLKIMFVNSVTTTDVGDDTSVAVDAGIAHNLSTGDSISVEGASTGAEKINGIYVITVTGVNTFTYTVTGENLGALTPTLHYAQLGNELFNVLLPNGRKLLNEYTVIGQSPISVPDATQDGPVGISVIKSSVSQKSNLTFAGLMPVGTGNLTVADSSLYFVGERVDIAAGTGTLDTNLTAGSYAISAIVDSTTITLGAVSAAGDGSGDCNITNLELLVEDGSLFTVGDVVMFEISTPAFTPTPTAPLVSPPGLGYFLVSEVNGNYIKLHDYTGVTLTPDVGFTGYSNLVNISGINSSMIAAWVSSGLSNIVTRSTFDGLEVTAGNSIKVADASKFEAGDQVIFSDNYDENGITSLPVNIDASTIYIVSTVDLMTNVVSFTGLEITQVSTGPSDTFQITNLTKTQGSTVFIDSGMNYGRQVNFLGVLGLSVPESVQDDSSFKFFSIIDSNPLTNVLQFRDSITLAQTTNDIMLDSTVGRTFLSLGLANEDYVDVDFDGDDERVFRLTEDGVQASRFFLFCEYFFAGVAYEFAGTIVPLVVNDTNLYIGNSADSVANGWTFQINQNATLQAATEDSGFDLSQSVKNNILTSDLSQIAFNENDPAVVNDAIWTYDPIKNRNSSALAESWNLFLDRDSANADMLISAGTAVTNLFVRGFEQIDYNVMDSILNVCEKRKDVFSIFDGVDAPDIDVGLRKMVGVGSQGEISRWGGIFDGRDIFFDANYTKLNVQGVKTISVAAIITLNRAGNIYWFPPAGYTTGRIPASYSLRQKFLRTYNFSADPVSDIARLYDANINPTRVNDQGQFIYGQKTMLKRGSALNRMNVIMLVAGIHKRFANYLDFKVFQLNTAALRNNIQTDLQSQLDLIKSSNPQGITAGKVICDSTNNTPDIIDTNQLIVDVVLQPTRAAEFITLRTTVQRTGAELDVTNTILGG